MGCDFHCVLQAKKGDLWETLIYDIFPGRNYEFFNWLAGVRGQDEGIGNKDFPDDFKCKIDSDGIRYHNGIYIGEHSFGHVYADVFMNAFSPRSIRPYRDGLRLFLGDYEAHNFRIVYGFDS